MGTTTVSKDTTKQQITIKRTFAAPLALVWAAWTEKDMIEKWFGPEGWPMTVDTLDFQPGGILHYHMTGPDGTKAYGLTSFLTIEPEVRITSGDGFCDAQGTINTELPQAHWDTSFHAEGESTKVIVVITYQSASDMQTIISMGFEEGFGMSLNQLAALVENV